MSYSDELYKMIERLLPRIEEEVPARGSFSPVREFFCNENPAIAIERYQLSVVRIEGVTSEKSDRCYNP